MSDIKTLINTTLNQKPAEFADSFKEIILDKLRTAIENKKIELAGSIVTQSEPQNQEQSSEEPTDA